MIAGKDGHRRQAVSSGATNSLDRSDPRAFSPVELFRQEPFRTSESDSVELNATPITRGGRRPAGSWAG